MHFNLFPGMSGELHSIGMMIVVINAVIHVIFAGAVARDAGVFAKRHYQTHLVSPVTWAFATLVGGVLIAAVYWFMHHLNMTNLSRSKKEHQK